MCEVVALHIAPDILDVVQLGGVFRQPFEGQPGARGERLCGQLAGVDRPVIENRDQGPGSFGGAVGGAELVEQGDKVGGALGGSIREFRRSVKDDEPVKPADRSDEPRDTTRV